MEANSATGYTMRRWLLIGIFLVAGAGLLYRAVDLQVVHQEFLRQHGDARSIRVVDIPAHRGMITDRNDEPLAISTPVDSIWVSPRDVFANDEKLPLLAAALDMDAGTLQGMLRDRITREFVYLKRLVAPEEANRIDALDISGVHLQREFKRYYPSGEVVAHLIGFTDVDDAGQEGVELAFDEWLRGTPGQKRVLKDRLGHVVQNIDSVAAPQPGRTLRLSIDRRVQYLAYRELKAAVARHGAQSGSLVMLDADTGELLAMASQPSYNPNNRTGFRSDHYRNRVATDVFEPGSTLKPFTIAAALLSGQFTPGSMIETAPGNIRVGKHVIRDVRNFGAIDVAHVIKKSSNVGATRIALALGPAPLWEMYAAAGFGQPTGSGFPGESAGMLTHPKTWSEVELATISFGHGIAVTALQLAQAYSIIASDGVLHPVHLTRVDEPLPGRRVIPVDVAREVRRMLESAVLEGGTGTRAAVRGYRVAGKTGTAHKAVGGGYAEHQYRSLFAGMIPASDPRLVLVVVIDEPQGDQYFGGQVAAPVFSRVMKGAVRILNIPPDDMPSLETRMAIAHGDAAAKRRLQE